MLIPSVIFREVSSVFWAYTSAELYCFQTVSFTFIFCVYYWEYYCFSVSSALYYLLFFLQTVHKKTFYYLEQLILKHKLHQNTVRIKEINGIFPIILLLLWCCVIVIVWSPSISVSVCLQRALIFTTPLSSTLRRWRTSCSAPFPAGLKIIFNKCSTCLMKQNVNFCWIVFRL